MAEPTETLLDDALAEYRAAPPPLAAHHTADGIRDTVRHRRQVRGALWAVAVAVLVAVVPTVAPAGRHGHSPVQPPASVAPTPTVQPAPTESPTTLASPPGTAPDLYVPGTWLTLGELPFDSTYRRIAVTRQPTRYTSPLSGTPSSCYAMDLAIVSSGGMNHWQLWVFWNKPRDSRTVTAQLAAFQLRYPDVAAARTAFQRIRAQLTGCGHVHINDVNTGEPLVTSVTQVATLTDGFSFVHTLRTATGQPRSTAIWGSDSHVYFVLRGQVIALITVGADPAIDRSDDDQAVLQRMADHLCRYGGSAADPLCR